MTRLTLVSPRNKHLLEARVNINALVALLTPAAEVGLAIPPDLVTAVLDELRTVAALLEDAS